jgi:Mn-dependent DtxR family transcriptional regulator
MNPRPPGGNQPAPIDLLNQIPPLLPQFLRKRRVGLPAVAELMGELDVERPDLFVLIFLNLVQGSYGGPATLAQIRAEEPYATIDRYSAPLARLLEKGLVMRDKAGAYALSPQAKDAVDRLHTAGRAYVSQFRPLPAEDLEELARQLERAVDAVVADPVLAPRPGSHLAGSLSLRPFDAKMTPMARIEQSVHELWGARDDAHVKAWRDAGLEGPPMAALTRVWSGEARTVSDLHKALENEQTPEDVDSSLAFLAEKDYVIHDGDDLLQVTPEGALVREDIERETDRIYFASWPYTIAEAEWVRDKLTQLIEHLNPQ